jgi:hypothetical protein
MSEPSTAFNPARLSDQLDEALYAAGWGAGTRLKRERTDLINWLRKKANGQQAAIQLASRGNRIENRRG